VPWPVDSPSPESVASKVSYTGNAIHKSHTSPAGPPALKADEAKCDNYGKKGWPKLTDALRLAIRSQYIGQFRGDFPSRAWVHINGVLHEARLTGQGQGNYHGFPINDVDQYPEFDKAMLNNSLENIPNVEIDRIKG
jgi:hypothetical protein